MRPFWRVPRLAAGLGALSFATYLAAGAPGAAGADSQGASVRMSMSHQVRYRTMMVVRGRLESGEAGHRIAVDFRPAGHDWTTVRTAVSGEGGAFKFVLRPTRSGELRVRIDEPQAQTADTGGEGAGSLSSDAQRIDVAPAISARTRRLNVRAGQRAVLSGSLQPGVSGRVVRAQGRVHGRWRTLARGRTRANGHFRMRFRARGVGSTPIRIAFAGDRANARMVKRVGRLNVFRPAMASWYGPGFYGGHLACGGTLGVGTLGVAHKTLPCGTKITLRYRGHTVRCAVIDRGPFVAGREFDLTGATKAALHFGSTGTVWVAT
jgi:peptidoglycan lytic transglycosylase